MRRTVGWAVSAIAVVALVAAVGAPVYAEDETVGVAQPSDTVTLELRDTSIKSAIEILFRNSGKNFSVDPTVSGMVPTLSFKDVPFDTALKNLTKSAGLVYRTDGNIYIITRRPESSSGSSDTPPPPPPAYDPVPELEQPTTSEIVIDKVPLNHTGASELLAIMSGQGREYSGVYGGNTSGYGGYGGFGSGFGSGFNSGFSSGVNIIGGYGGYGGYGSSGGYGGYGGSGGYGGYGGYGGGYRNYNNSYNDNNNVYGNYRSAW